MNANHFSFKYLCFFETIAIRPECNPLHRLAEIFHFYWQRVLCSTCCSEDATCSNRGALQADSFGS